jgi:hypothetical protein
MTVLMKGLARDDERFADAHSGCWCGRVKKFVIDTVCRSRPECLPAAYCGGGGREFL